MLNVNDVISNNYAYEKKVFTQTQCSNNANCIEPIRNILVLLIRELKSTSLIWNFVWFLFRTTYM